MEGLRSYCSELSSDQPSPGGGSAAAAAGAMSASLLIMVCGITGRSKKHAKDWTELAKLKDEIKVKRDSLISLSMEDAEAYDHVFAAAKNVKQNMNEDTVLGYQSALRHASEVPLRTIEQCLSVLELAVRIAEIGSESAASDTGVAILLSEAGLRGAAMNVDINLRDITDSSYSKKMRKSMETSEGKARGLVKKGLSTLGRSAH